MKKPGLSVVFFLFLLQTLIGQDKYFQQETDYIMDITLDDINREVFGSVSLTYSNNSPDTLHFLYFNLWANAYKDNSTALAESSNAIMYKAFPFFKESDKGGYKKLVLFQGIDSLTIVKTNNKDIIRVNLSKPILPGTVTNLSISFVLKVPLYLAGNCEWSINGLDFANWYPRPAVYDREGWHADPNYPMGMLYGDFGDYEVNITLPDNYIVAASGENKTSAEIITIDSLSSTHGMTYHGDKPLGSSKTFKTIQFVANNVNDFAWSAHKDFAVQKTSIQFSPLKKTNIYLYYTPNQNYNNDSLNFLNTVKSVIQYYSLALSEYPNSNLSIVYSPFINAFNSVHSSLYFVNDIYDKDSYSVDLLQKVGEDYFGRLIGINPALYGWISNGLSLYYSSMFIENTNKNNNVINNLLGIKRIIPELRQNILSPLSTPLTQRNTNQLNSQNRLAIEYRMMSDVMGIREFQQRMKKYFNTWKYKHPVAKDFQESLDAEHKHDWFWYDQLYTNHNIDYELKKVQRKDDFILLTLKNKGKVAAPYSIQQINHKIPTLTQWREGFLEESQITIPNKNGNLIALNAMPYSLDINSKNNLRNIKNKRVNPVNFKFGFSSDYNRNQIISLLPYLGYNLYDKFQLGIVVNNFSGSQKTFQYVIAPAFSFKDSKLIGNATLQYLLLLSDSLNTHINIGLHTKSYSYYRSEKYDYADRYWKINPYLNFYLHSKSDRIVTNKFTLQSNYIRFYNHELRFDTLGNFLNSTLKHDNRIVTGFSYTHKKSTVLSDIKFTSSVQHFRFTYFDDSRRDRIRWLNELNARFKYDNKRMVYFRAWVGAMLYNSHADSDNAVFTSYQPGVLSLFSNGIIDNMTTFDGITLGRSAQDGLASAQIISNTNGGFKGSFTSALTSGISNHYLTSINVQADLPISSVYFPLSAYLDLGYGDMAIAGPVQTKFMWEFGAMLDYFGIFKIYFPIAYNQELKYLYSQTRSGNFFGRISFALDLHRINIRNKPDLNLHFVD